MNDLIIICMLFNLKALFEKEDLSDIDEFYEEAYEVFLNVGPDLELNAMAKRSIGSSLDEIAECERTLLSDPLAAVQLMQRGVDDLVIAYLIAENGLDRKGLADIDGFPMMWFVYFLKRMKKLVRLLDPDLDDHAIHDIERTARDSGRLGIRGPSRDQISAPLTYDELTEELQTLDRMVEEQRRSLMDLSSSFDGDTDKEKNAGNQLYILFDRAEEMFAIYNVSRLIFDNEVYMRHSDLVIEDGADIGMVKAAPELLHRIKRLQGSVSKSID